MINLSNPELKESIPEELPPASLETLKQLRGENCPTSKSPEFKIAPIQRFLRRVMSPDSPTRGVLIIHGTGSGKTCSSIQIAEEYIIRPEFQDKRVLILANPSVQENFKNQIFDVSRIQNLDGVLLTKQCTGRRYLDIIERSYAGQLKLTDRASQNKIQSLASKLVSEFYEFQGYNEFANIISTQQRFNETGLNAWIHKTFDNRLIIIDEAHNIRESSENETSKLVSVELEHILKVADGVTLILLTATPMYDKFEEILYFFNLFLWNERKIKKVIKPSEIFTPNGEFKEGQETKFRSWCSDYVSYVRGDNPFTFPFRLPPPKELIATVKKIDIMGNPIKPYKSFLTLTQSFVQPLQEKAISNLKIKGLNISSDLICTFPNQKSFKETFDRTDEGLVYAKGVEPFLAPENIAKYSSKFALITETLKNSEGLVFVYSNQVEYGANLFAMCLEEHGYAPAYGDKIMANTTAKKGKYVLFTSEVPDSEIKRIIIRLKKVDNKDGSDIRVIISSPKISEGIDFRFVRQIHILDPWFNMSRIEQVIGRGIRTCSHSALPFEKQNCTIYLHVCSFKDSDKETLDEYMYRNFVEEKAIRIAKIKQAIVESAMDCPLQQLITQDWKELHIPQTRSDGTTTDLQLQEMVAPTFIKNNAMICKTTSAPNDPQHIRPLSTILDVSYEIKEKLTKLFTQKPIWKLSELISQKILKQYEPATLEYNIQHIIETGFDFNGVGRLYSKGDLITLGTNKTLQEFDHMPELNQKKKLVEPQKDEEKEEETVLNFESVPPEFPREVAEWFLVDELPEKEKIKYILNFMKNNPETLPIYIADLVVSRTPDILVFGSNKIYKDGELTTLIDEDQDLYRKWLKNAKNKFTQNRELIFASMKESLIFNIDEKSKEIKKAQRSKNIGGRTCSVYNETILNNFALWLHDAKFPESVKVKKDRCNYLSLLIRKEILNKNPRIFWICPEVYQVFSEDQNREDLLKRLKD